MYIYNKNIKCIIYEILPLALDKLFCFINHKRFLKNSTICVHLLAQNDSQKFLIMHM